MSPIKIFQYRQISLPLHFQVRGGFQPTIHIQCTLNYRDPSQVCVCLSVSIGGKFTTKGHHPGSGDWIITRVACPPPPPSHYHDRVFFKSLFANVCLCIKIQLIGCVSATQTWRFIGNGLDRSFWNFLSVVNIKALLFSYRFYIFLFRGERPPWNVLRYLST